MVALSGDNLFAITGAMICDGTGKRPPFEGEVIVEGETIKKVIPFSPAEPYPPFPGKKISGKGLLLAPGFVDIHSHSDLSFFAAPEAEGLLAQGVTSVITGNCGLSPFPILTEEVRNHLQEIYARYGERLSWSTFREYAGKLQERAPGVNLAAFCGHNTLRANFSSYTFRESSPRMSACMKDALSETLSEGALGLSTGLLYVPGKFASREELLALMEVLKEKNALYSTHLRSEGAFLEEALVEALELGKASSGRVLISHLKTAGKENWWKIGKILEMLESARKEGLELFADRYPYTFAQSSLSLLLPGKYESMSDRDIMAELRLLPEKELELLAGEVDASGRDWEKVILTATESPFALRNLLPGKSMKEACSSTGSSPGKLLIRILQEDSPGSMAAFGGMSGENLEKILRKEFVACGTDESCRSLDFSLGKSHPRGFGSFPFFARKLMALGVPPEKIIYRFTGLPSEILHWERRGVIREGAYADLVLLSWEDYKDNATFAQPHAAASGVVKVFVNGVEKGRKRNGKVLSASGEKLFS